LAGEDSLAARIGVVVTSIAGPNRALKAIADGCSSRQYPFWVIGDAVSPADFRMDGCRFLDIENQLKTGFEFAERCPTNHYARKNIGYLLAMAEGVEILIETDDDNYPAADFWLPRSIRHRCASLRDKRWVNIYRYFTDAQIWPRGFPLEFARDAAPPLDALPQVDLLCPVQQGLTDGNPDVDAIYRLLFPLPVSFQKAPAVAVSRGSWCPFNSQNTAWFSRAFPLLYLPAYCPFRATDIWRGLIAQRIGWENEWSLLFHSANGFQERNDHNLMRDFTDEVPVYLNARRVAQALESLSLQPGEEAIPENLLRCYESLAGGGIFHKQEIQLLESWLADLRKLRAGEWAAAIGEAGAARH